ncbi:hypothetical protein SFC07_10085 [Corynebacterium callunae]|uniref:hypothetical protein n=1 Tax=Corynebacterium callunae TaxID=1721 RepID=UPI003982970D
MKIHRTLLAAAVVATTFSASLLPLPAAQAASVEVNGALCTITVTTADMAALRAEILATERLSLGTLTSLVDGLDPEINLLVSELSEQALTGTIEIGSLSTAAQAAWAAFYQAGRSAGFSQNDLSAIIIAAVLPEYLAGQLDREFTPKLVGKLDVAKANAEGFIAQIKSYPAGMGVDATNSTFFNYTVSARAKELLTPAMAPFDVIVNGVIEPYQTCISKLANPDNPGAPGDPGDPGNPNTPNDGGGAAGGSSAFGSS